MILLLVYRGCSKQVSCGFSGVSNFLEVRLENRSHSRTKVNGERQALFECASKGVALRGAASGGHQPSCLQSTSGSLLGARPKPAKLSCQTAEHLLGSTVPIPTDLLSPWPTDLSLQEALGQ